MSELVKLRCSNKHCTLRSGFTVLKEQEKEILKRECMVCKKPVMKMELVLTSIREDGTIVKTEV